MAGTGKTTFMQVRLRIQFDFFIPSLRVLTLSCVFECHTIEIECSYSWEENSWLHHQSGPRSSQSALHAQHWHSRLRQIQRRHETVRIVMTWESFSHGSPPNRKTHVTFCRYNLGPNGGILTSLNLFATRFDQVIQFVEKRAPGIKYVFVDTPGQIEVFNWSASGTIITEAFASKYPTIVTYIVDTPRCINPATFMSSSFCGFLSLFCVFLIF